jgi:zinc/manganese transport system permease protein
VIVDPAEWGILWPAFIAGVLVTATHVPLGMQVLDRGIVFIDLAIAQVAALGVIIADYLGWSPTGIAIQVAALSAALICAALPLVAVGVAMSLLGRVGLRTPG